MPAPSISIFQGPPNTGFTVLNDLAGGTNIVYTGIARSMQPQAQALTVASVSKANPAVVTVNGHGLASDNTVTVSGGTGDWAGINGAQKITVIDSNTFSIPVNTSAYAGSFAGTITTMAPQSSAAIWSIQKNYYDGSGNLLRSAWANGTPADNQIWDNRATLSYQ